MTVEHHDDGHGAHAHAADAHDDHGHDDHGHDDHHVSEPPAQGSRAAELITTGLLFVSAALSWVVLVDVGFLHHDVAGSRCFPGSIPAICRSRGRCGSTR